MKKGKALFLLLVIFLLTGCSSNKDVNTINYDLYVGDSFDENIVVTLPKDAYKKAKKNQDEDYTSIEYSLLKEDLKPIYSNHTEFYNKVIDKGLKTVDVSLNYSYTEDEFYNSNYIMNCFENYDIVSDEDYFEVVLSGEFYCYNNMKTNITVDSLYTVLESNGTKNENQYSWVINQDNYKNVDLKYRVSRVVNPDLDPFLEDDTSSSSTGVWDIIKTILIIVVLIALLIIVYKYYKNHKKGNQYS